MHIFTKILVHINQYCVYASALFMGSMAVIVFYDVITRYILNSPSIWANEVATYFMQFIVFFTMGFLHLGRKHLRVTFFIENLKGNTRKLMETITDLLIIPYAFVLVIYGYNLAEHAFNLGMTSPTLLAVPLWIPYSFIFIGGGLLISATIFSIVTIWMPSLVERGKIN
ncbi:hypothetical protein BTR23_12330 [Alkalihalophilus pseudofirmus]|nr:hypothetical protein BTR23_12330 [Alkalihalophilus pseudofirmus]